MKKIAILFLSVFAIIGLAGCSEQTAKVKYVSEMVDTIPDLTGAYAGLHDLYTSPLSYTTDEWTTGFREHKTEIEEEYDQIKDLTPLESLTDVHASLLSVLELTIETNNLIDEQIQKGEELDFDTHLAKLNELTAGLEQAVANFKDISTAKGE